MFFLPLQAIPSAFCGLFPPNGEICETFSNLPKQPGCPSDLRRHQFLGAPLLGCHRRGGTRQRSRTRYVQHPFTAIRSQMESNMGYDESISRYFLNRAFDHHFISRGTKALTWSTPSGIKIATAASETASLKHYIWSSLPGGKKTSGGKFAVPHCDSKAAIDDYILDKLPELAKKTTFLWVGYYASNLALLPMAKVEYLVSTIPPPPISSRPLSKSTGEETRTSLIRNPRNPPANTPGPNPARPTPSSPWAATSASTSASTPPPSSATPPPPSPPNTPQSSPKTSPAPTPCPSGPPSRAGRPRTPKRAPRRSTRGSPRPGPSSRRSCSGGRRWGSGRG